LALSKAIYPRIVQELKDARNEWEKDFSIKKLLKNSSVPWFWTFDHFIDFHQPTSDHVTSVKHILDDKELVQLILTNFESVSSKNHLLKRLLFTRANIFCGLLDQRGMSDSSSTLTNLMANNGWTKTEFTFDEKLTMLMVDCREDEKNIEYWIQYLGMRGVQVVLKSLFESAFYSKTRPICSFF
jgi:hypothetical protein